MYQHTQYITPSITDLQSFKEWWIHTDEDSQTSFRTALSSGKVYTVFPLSLTDSIQCRILVAGRHLSSGLPRTHLRGHRGTAVGHGGVPRRREHGHHSWRLRLSRGNSGRHPPIRCRVSNCVPHGDQHDVHHG